jgi:hypothetical protein
MEPNAPEAPPIEIPSESLSEDTLTAVIEGFILREGTDYGTAEISLETKIEQIRRQLTQGKVRIVFDPASQSVTLMIEKDWLKIRKGLPETEAQILPFDE